MRKSVFLSAIAMMGFLGAATAQAQIPKQQPAEFPPTSYKGKQYVDSQGCVFIRAGIDGEVSWVPRVTRDRKTVCGFEPSLPGLVAAAPTPAPEAAPAEVIAVAPAAEAPAPAPAPVAEAPVVAEVVAPRPAPAPVPRRATPRPVPVAAAQPRRPVQFERSVPVQRDPSVVTAHTRIVPKHVAENRVNTRNVTVPRGYKKVWSDGRLNPKRAEQNLQGRSDMLLIWTQTVPRRLIDRRSGRDVTASVPLVYPYTSIAQQRRALGEVKIVQRDGKIVKRIVRSKRAAPAHRQPVYSTRSAPAQPKAVKKVKKASVAGKSYVQIGTFRQSANAQKAAQQIARMGMPARIGKHRKGGKRYLSVQAGPFGDARAMSSALQKLRRAGYSDAFARN